MPGLCRFLFILLAGLVFWSCGVSESGGSDTLTFRLNDSLKTASGKYDSVQLDLYITSGTDTTFRKMLFRGKYQDASQLENLSLGGNLSGDFIIRVIGFRNNEKILEVGVPFNGGQASKKPILYKTPPAPTGKSPPEFVSGLENVSMPEGATQRISIKARDEDGTAIHFVIENLDSLRSLFAHEAITISVGGDSLVLTFSPGYTPGNYPFRIALTDSGAPSVVQTLIISVGLVNRPPTISFAEPDSGPSFLIREGKTLSFKVAAMDPDSGDEVRLLALESPPWPGCGLGSFDSETGIFSFSPSFRCADTGAFALPELQFRGRDNGTPPETGSLTVHISVQDSNSAPVWSQNTAPAMGKEGKEMTLDLRGFYLGDREQDSVTFTASCGQILHSPLRWSFTPGFRDSGEKDCDINASDSHNPPAASHLVLNLSILDSVRAVDVAILSPARGFITNDSVVVVLWTVGDQTRTDDTTEILGKEGPNLIQRTFTDSLGNSGTDTVTVFRDTNPPQKPTVSVTALTNNPKPKWSWKSGGDGYGLFRIRIITANPPTESLEVKDTSYTPAQPLTHGRHVLYVQERDSAGNWSPLDSGVVRVDLVAPVVKITAPLDGHVTNQDSVEVQWTVDDVAQTPSKHALDEDGNAFTKSVTDSAGNTGAMSITVTRRSHVVFVNAVAADGGDGNSWVTAYRSLQDGLTKSQSGWEVWVAKGTYAPTDGLPAGVDTSFVMKAASSILGGFVGSEKIKSARDWKANETKISGETILARLPVGSIIPPLVIGAEGGRLDGFIVEKGRSHKGSGLHASAASSIIVANCVFRNHEGTAEEGGGAVQSYGSNFSISNSEFAANTNSGEGGALSLLGMNATLSNCKFIGNRSIRSGGALYVDNEASVTISNSAFQGNISQSSGGAIAHRGWIEIKHSYLLENSSGLDGGAIYSQSNYLTLSNSVFANNSADQNGGGIYAFFPNIFGSNLTFYGNASKGSGGALFYGGAELSPSAIHLQNTIFWGNTSLDAGTQIALNPAISASATFTFEYSDIEGGVAGVSKTDSANWTTGSGVISVDPGFRATGNLTGPDGVFMTSDDGLTLNGGPAVNSGKLSGAPVTDITGSIRPKGGYVDMGAYEH